MYKKLDNNNIYIYTCRREVKKACNFHKYTFKINE